MSIKISLNDDEKIGQLLLLDRNKRETERNSIIDANYKMILEY